MGAVMALSAGQLKAIGGFATLADYLADDYQLGNHVFRQGKRIEFAKVVVDCWDSPMGWPQVWRHQLRWARTMRVCKPSLFFFSITENATLWPLLWLLANASHVWIAKTAHTATRFSLDFSIQTPLLAFIFFLTVRIATSLHQQMKLTQCRSHFPYWWLAPVKDLLNVALWVAAFWGNQIEWRGERYKVVKDGKLERVNRR